MKRLVAAAMLALSLSACDGGSKPPPTPAPSAKAPTAVLPAYKATPSPTLAAVKKRGYVACGVHQGLPGFAYPDVHSVWRGFDVDICRAVAAAVLGDARKVRFTAISAQDRFTALQKGRIDILARNTSWTFARDAGLGLDFAAVTYFDGQGFLAPKALGLTSAEELSGARICVQAGTAISPSTSRRAGSPTSPWSCRPKPRPGASTRTTDAMSSPPTSRRSRAHARC